MLKAWYGSVVDHVPFRSVGGRLDHRRDTVRLCAP
jgi:hypothetical protein